MAAVMELIERPAVTSSRRMWRVDPEAAYASFTIRNRFAFVKNQTITGQFNDISGTVMLDERHPSKSRVTLEIGVAGVATGSARRDKHLLAEHFFAVDRFPTMSFVSETVEPIACSEDRFVVTGLLSVRGVDRVASFDVRFSPNDSIGRPWSARVLASGTLDRRDFGMTWSNPMVRIADPVEIELSARAVLAGSATS